MKNLDIKSVASEYLKEIEYIRVKGGELSKRDYDLKMKYISECREELFNRGVTSWCEMLELAK